MFGVTTEDTPTKQLEIEFAGRTMPVGVPDQGQLAVLINAQEWFRRQRRTLDELEPQLAALGPVATRDPNNPIVIKSKAVGEEGVKHVGRFLSILKTLFLDPDDWDMIQDGMVDREIRWQDVADIPALILEASNAADYAGVPGNRAGRRAAAKSGRRAR